MVRLHGLVTTSDATENDVWLQRAWYKGVTQGLATVVAVRGPTSAGQEPGQRFVDEQNLSGLDVSGGDRMSPSGGIFAKLNF